MEKTLQRNKIQVEKKEEGKKWITFTNNINIPNETNNSTFLNQQNITALKNGGYEMPGSFKTQLPSIFLYFRNLFTISESWLLQFAEKYLVIPSSPSPSCFSLEIIISESWLLQFAEKYLVIPCLVALVVSP